MDRRPRTCGGCSLNYIIPDYYRCSSTAEPAILAVPYSRAPHAECAAPADVRSATLPARDCIRARYVCSRGNQA